MELEKLLNELINEKLYQIVLSNPRVFDETLAKKIKIRPVMLKNELVYQKTSYVGTKVLHANHSKEQTVTQVMDLIQSDFKQMLLENVEGNVTVLVSKKGKMTIKRSQAQKEADPVLLHNREKKYLLEPGVVVPFLVDLGVQTKEGKIINSKYDKFRQINRFLEFIDDIVPSLPKDRQLRILDFGCGKSYLTFAVYYYLHILKGYDLLVTGLDLKDDVIKNCNALAVKYGYKGLNFEKGNIKDYIGANQVDMVITLHACDIATDFALEKAVKWGAKVILSVPCCQHEVHKQISCDALEPVLKYGVIKERMSALFTDAIRAEKLEACGYDTQILEFIDMEHTPKNIMIRAVKKTISKEEKEEKERQLKQLTDFLNVEQMLQKLL
ncbi:MAG: SAM-dependent methyltransferase [Lachnospiraceae bacterium]|nr:SAM-dependent methyltransferase [Lachnospiraceae bacterium]